MIFVGVDWAEAHHEACVLNESGDVLARKKIPDTLVGVRELHELLTPFVDEPDQAVVGIEKDRGLIVTAILRANYRVYELNPMSVARYRERHVTSGSKSDPGDAKVLADLVRTDRHNHREAAGDTEGADAIKVLARAHQSAIWSRQREKNALRSALKDYYPEALSAFGTDLDSGETHWRSWRSPPRPPSEPTSRSLRSPQHFAAAVANATLSAPPRGSRRPCAKTSCASVPGSKRPSERSQLPT